MPLTDDEFAERVQSIEREAQRQLDGLTVATRCGEPEISIRFPASVPASIIDRFARLVLKAAPDILTSWIHDETAKAEELWLQ